jgi:hypothetical protein
VGFDNLGKERLIHVQCHTDGMHETMLFVRIASVKLTAGWSPLALLDRDEVCLVGPCVPKLKLHDDVEPVTAVHQEALVLDRKRTLALEA